MKLHVTLYKINPEYYKYIVIVINISEGTR